MTDENQQSHKTLAQLLQGINILDIQGDTDIPVPGLAYHSGRVEPGEVFVALKGCQTDGHRFIGQAIAQGAGAVVLEDHTPEATGVTTVRTSDSRLALAHMAAALNDHPSRDLTVIGITGTNGKTTTSYLLEAIWRAGEAQVGVIGTVNCRFGDQVRPALVTTPESLDLQNLLGEMREAQMGCAILEVSSHALDLKRTHGCHFSGAIFTNLTQDHLDYHVTMESYFAAKSRLFTELLTNPGGKEGLAVINYDDPWGRKLLARLATPRLTFGFDAAADIHPQHYALSPRGVQARLATPFGVLEISSPLVGDYNLANILAATAMALGLGIDPEQVAAGLEGISGVDGRLEPVSMPGQPLVLVDYAHTPDALNQVLQALKKLDFHRIITIFGCGGDRDRTKRPLMGQIAAQGSDLVIITSDNPRTEDPLAIITDIAAGLGHLGYHPLEIGDLASARHGYVLEPDRRGAIRLGVELGGPGDVILLAGKGHETYQIVGTRRHHFDDREEARAALLAKARAQAGMAA